PVADTRIGELRLVRHSRAVDVRRLHRTVCPDDHVHHYRFAIRSLEQRGGTGRQLGRNHREDYCPRVHRGGLRGGVRVDRRALWRFRIDVSNSDVQAPLAIFGFLGELDLIEISYAVFSLKKKTPTTNTVSMRAPGCP